MKNSSKPSPKTRSYQNTSLNLSQSLFMDETSADLENYLNSSLPETSTVTSEQELECSTINALSKSIKGKFHKSSRDSKKNKFFKSKSSDDNLPVNSNEIPVINEAMKKIFKETPYQPKLKHSPKVLKTYSNKHKEKTKIVESFGLPDEPIYSVDPSFPKEQNSIDLDIEPDNNFNNSLVLGHSMPSDELQSSEITLNDEFRRKSFSTIDTVLFNGGSLEADVKEGFNFEEDNMIQESESSNERNLGNKNRSPIVLMKSLNLNDICLLETNNLSPSNNGREMLLDRWHSFSLKLKNSKGFQKSNTPQGTSKGSGIRINNANSRRSTRSHTSTIEFGSSSTKNTNVIKQKLEKNARDKDLVLKDNFSSRLVEQKYETSEEKTKKIPNDIDVLIPRRITRRSAQQTVDSLPININNATCSSSFKSPVRKNEAILDETPAVNNDKKDKNSKITVAVDNGGKSVENDGPLNNPPENDVDITSPNNLLRNIRTSLRSSYSSKKLQNKMKSSLPCEQKSVQNHSSTSKRKGYSLQKELKTLLAEAQTSVTSEEVDNPSVSGLEGFVKIMNLDDKMNKTHSSSPAESKQFNRTINLDQERDTPIRKSNRLKLYSNEKTSDENMSTPSNNGVSHVQMKRSSKGHKKKQSEIQDTYYSEKSLKDEELSQKSNTEKEITQNPLLFILDEVPKNTGYSVSYLGSTEINIISLQQSNEEIITNEGNVLEENYDIQLNGKIQDASKELNRTKNLDQESDTPIRKSNRLILYSNEKNTDNKSTPSNNEVSHVQVKRSSKKSKRKPSEIQYTSYSAKSLEDEELTQKLSTEKVISQNPLLFRIDKIPKNTEYSVSYSENTKLNSIILHQSNEETITKKDNILEENYNDIQINGKIQDESITSTDSGNILDKNNKEEKNTKVAENMETQTNNEVSHGQVKRLRGRPKKKLFENQGNLELSKSSDENNLSENTSTAKNSIHKQLFISIDRITKTAEDNHSNVEIRESCDEENIPNKANAIKENYNEIQINIEKCDESISCTDSEIIFHENISNNQEPTKRKRGRPKKKKELKHDEYESKNINNKPEQLIENHDEVQINKQMNDESISRNDSDVIIEKQNNSDLGNQELMKRKGCSPKKCIESRHHEKGSEINNCIDKDMQPLSGKYDESNIIENDFVVKNGKPIYNYQEKTENNAKEGSIQTEICTSSVIIDDNIQMTTDSLRELQFSEPENTLAVEEKQNYGESNIKKKDGKKEGLHDKLQMVEYFQDTKLDEKTGQFIGDLQNKQTYDEKFGTKFESDRKTSDIDLLPEFKFQKLVPDSENQIIDEKNLNEQKVDKAIVVSEAMTSLGKIGSTDSITKIKETCNTNITKEYSDFGYDIHRRTSFRKILERVMEVSRSEMEMAKSEKMENQRCKSVPPKVFHDKVETNNILKCASADSKLKYLQDKKNSHADLSKVKKCLDFNSQSKFHDKNIVSRKPTKSFHVASKKLGNTSINPKPGKNVYLEQIKSSTNGVVSTFNISTNCTDEDPKEIILSEGFEAGTKTNMNNSHSKSIENESQQKHMLDSKFDIASPEKYIKNHEEQKNSLLEDTSANAPYERSRSKSFSEGKTIQKFNNRTKSVLGRKFKNRNRTSGGMSGSTEVVKKVYEFKVGDAVWGKVGKYPYWPGLVMEDPETSDFKKFRLLRTNPYYHIRFFGDNGKRAWTAYCIPYEGSEDLDNLRKQFSMEGHQNDYLVKASHVGKWKKAVQEAEIVKNYSVEKKIEFFEKILPSKERIPILEKTDEIPTENYQRRRSKSFSFSASILKSTKTKPENHDTQKEKIPMKTSSLISCIESVVNNYTELSTKSDCDVSLSRNKNSPIKNNSLSCDENFTNSDKNLMKTSIETTTDVSPPKKRSIAMKDSSVIACIDDVVKKFCSPNVHNSDENYTQRKKSRESKRKIQDSDSDIDVGLQLLDIPAVDVIDSQLADLKLPEQNSLSKSPEQSILNRTPVSSRKAGVNSPTRTRLRSSLKLDKRRLSNEFNLEGESSVSSKEPKVNSELLCSPRRLKLKRRTIEIGRIERETESNANSYIKNITTRLPEHKKNLFRGVTKEKVCQICEKPGDVVKCRGPCNGDFHIKCVESSLKETEELTLKEQKDLAMKEKLEIRNPPLEVSIEDNKQVEISTVISRKKFADNVVLSPINRKIPIMEQFDRKMKELMCQVESRISIDSTDTSSEEIDTSEKVKVDKKSNGKNPKKSKGLFKHVTADDVSLINLSDVDTIEQKDTLGEFVEQTSTADEGVYKCSYCTSTVIPPCFVCNSIMSKNGSTMRQRCSLQKCGRYYHLECLNVWHQTQWSFILHDKKKTEALDSFVCPRHSCHICASENLGFSMGRCPNDKLVKCLRCPATYHNSYHCVPAGTDILTSTQIICPRHVEGNKKSNTLNTIWCFVCSEGGNLICCETCPTSVHSECLPVNLLDDDTYICEDCESGRFPLYDEVVWVKCGTFRWWPAIILFPTEVPANVESKPHKKGEFVVKFFGTYNYFWVGRGRTFLYQEGDTGCLNNTKNKIDEAFSTALKEAADVYNFKKGLRAKKQKEVNNGLKPPPYVRIKVNRPVGNVRVFEGNLSNTTPCDCNPKDKNPCGPNSNCLNRLLLTECNPEICPAGERCKNQAFEKREYPQVKPYRTAGRGWGLKALEPIKKGQFVIEYVGEIIDDEEYQRRITRMHQQKDENYYFLTIDKDRMLDAGPKGNAARFMNHSCNPNCETQKWTVNGDTRVGLFAIENISVDTELTFNYNLECVGTEKKICRCGAVNCSGFIGVKPEDQRSIKKNTSVKPVDQERPTNSVVNDTCFICGKPGDVGKCTHKSCLNSYHLECVQLDSWPEGKWKCPSHTCNVCSKSTSRICVHCNNSYCSSHLEGNIRLDDTLGYLCSEHDQARKKSTRRRTAINGSLDVSSSNSLNKSSSQNGMSSETLRSERYRKRTSCFESNIPEKKLKLND